MRSTSCVLRMTASSFAKSCTWFCRTMSTVRLRWRICSQRLQLWKRSGRAGPALLSLCVMIIPHLWRRRPRIKLTKKQLYIRHPVLKSSKRSCSLSVWIVWLSCSQIQLYASIGCSKKQRYSRKSSRAPMFSIRKANEHWHKVWLQWKSCKLGIETFVQWTQTF